MSRKRAKWSVSGPHYADGWWLVQNRAAVVPELTQVWFRHRQAARDYRDAVNQGRWKTARKIYAVSR